MLRKMMPLLMMLLLAGPVSAQMSYDPESGLKPGAPEKDAPEVDRANGGDEYEHALAAYQEGNSEAAIIVCNAIIKRYERGIWVERAMLLKARAYFKQSDLKRCNNTLEDFDKRFPGTPLTREMSELQLAVGLAYLDQGKGEGLRILQNMVEHNPYGPRSDEAQFRIAQYYYAKRNYREASDAYALTVVQYKDSRYYEEALFMRAKAIYLANEGPRRDPLPYEEARAGLKAYLRQYPQGEHAAEAGDLLVKIADVLAEKQFLIAEYYRKQKHMRAAQRYYRHVLRHYPESSWAEKAKQYLPPEEREVAPAEGATNTENRNDESP